MNTWGSDLQTGFNSEKTTYCYIDPQTLGHICITSGFKTAFSLLCATYLRYAERNLLVANFLHLLFIKVCKTCPRVWDAMSLKTGYARLMADGDYWGLMGIYLAAINP